MYFSNNLNNQLKNRMGRADSINLQARKLFERALRTGTKRRNANHALPNISEASHKGQHYMGAQTVDIRCIGGSVNKSADFDIHFNPLSDHIEARWVKVATAMLDGIDLPPIELILVKDTYYVVDGHHRVSVAHMLGIQFLDAIVTRWE
jgi:hypothetical protein